MTSLEQERFVAGLAAEGVPDDVIELPAFLFEEVLDGRYENITDGLQQALGRPPRDFRDWAIAEAARGTWSGTAVAA